MNLDLLGHASGTTNKNILSFLSFQVGIARRGGGHRRRRDQPRLDFEGRRKLTESAREFPKAFRLAEPVRVAPGGAGALAGPTTSALSLPCSICPSIPVEMAVKSVSALNRFVLREPCKSSDRSLYGDATLGNTSDCDRKHAHFRWGTWLAWYSFNRDYS